jgi:hypothetical protein
MAAAAKVSIENYGFVPYERAMVKSPSQTQDKFIVRLPDGMRDQISAAAKANNRTMTAEIVSRLERTFREERLSAVEGKIEEATDLAVDAVADAIIAKERLDKHEKELGNLAREVEALKKLLHKKGGN